MITHNSQENYNVQMQNIFELETKANDQNEETWIKSIEDACKIYRMSQLFLEDARGDYGKYKIAQLRFEFAKHKLFTLLEESSRKGITWSKNELLRKYLYEF